MGYYVRSVDPGAKRHSGGKEQLDVKANIGLRNRMEPSEPAGKDDVLRVSSYNQNFAAPYA